MSNVYFISDLHFGHKRITSFTDGLGKKWRTGDDYLENMQHIITNWNSVVNKKDLVWVLGDVAFSQEGFDALFELNGRIKMVRGNHDNSFSTEDWLKRVETVEGIAQYKGYWLTHAPIHPAELRGRKNIHGHVHHNSIRNSYTGEYDPNYINVCCEAVGEKPYPFSLIKDETYQEGRLC